MSQPDYRQAGACSCCRDLLGGRFDRRHFLHQIELSGRVEVYSDFVF